MTTMLSTLSTRLRTLIGDEDANHASYYTDSINGAARETYYVLHKKILDRTLVGGNALPNSHFEDWAVTTTPNFYTAATGGCAEETSTIRGPLGTSACKVTASGAGDYMYITSVNHPSLLDLMGESIDFKCWAYPETANDGYVEIYTIKADSTTQTLTSTTACPAGKWTLLELESQAINDDIVEIQFRYKIATDGQYVIFDGSRATGATTKDHVLPDDFIKGDLRQVRAQGSGSADDICDDLGLNPDFDPVQGWKVYNDGTYDYLHLPREYRERSIELVGFTYLEDDLDADADTMSLDDPQTNLLLTYAAYLLFERLSGVPSSESSQIYANAAWRWKDKYHTLKSSLRMIPPPAQIHLPTPY